jgi:hypothetical protein
VVVWETVLFEDGLGGKGERHREDPWRQRDKLWLGFLILLLGRAGYPK